MQVFKRVGSVISTILSSNYDDSDFSLRNPVNPLPSFHCFPDLPTEIRLKIWEFAIPSRTVPIYLHSHRSELSEIASHPFRANSHHHLIRSPTPDGDDRTLEAESQAQLSASSHTGISVFTCESGAYCKCRVRRNEICHAMPLPAMFYVSRESRDVLRGMYSEYFVGHYDKRGMILGKNPEFRVTPNSIADPAISGKGVVWNPALDTILLTMNIASSGDIQDIIHFVAIAAREIPQIRRAAIQIRIAMPPYQWSERGRFQKWRNWGPDGSWVPRKIVKFENLREIVIVREVGSKNDKMLPQEWRDRTMSIWQEELEGMRER